MGYRAAGIRINPLWQDVVNGLWKMPFLRESAEKRGFPQKLGKAFGFPAFPTGSGDDFFKFLYDLKWETK